MRIEGRLGLTSNGYVQKGLQAAQARNAAAALQWFELAHREEPDDPLARAWYGQSLCGVGRHREGVEQLVQAGQLYLAPNRLRVDKALEVLGQLQGWGAFERALELARRLAALRPADPRTQQLLAVTCGQLNLTAEALAAAHRAADLAPGQTMLQVLLASLEADARQYDAARRRLETLLDAGPAPREAFRAHKELARVLDAIGAHGAVFGHLDAAAELADQLPEYSRLDRSLIPSTIRQNDAAYDAALMGRWQHDAFPEAPRAPVFVLGFYRSGTTLTQEVLAAHPGVFVSDEVGLVWAMQQALHRLDPSTASVPDKIAKLDRDGIARLRTAYWDAARGRHGAQVDEGLFVDKYTLNTVDIGLINTVFPDARVLFVMRDPRDVCLSCVMQLMVPTPATRHLLRLSDAAALYAQVVDAWLAARPRLTMPYLEFRYEDAVGDFESTFRRVFDFLGLPWDASVVDFHRRAAGRFISSPSRHQVARPLYASSVEKWRRYNSALDEVSDRLAPFVRHFGYAP